MSKNSLPYGLLIGSIVPIFGFIIIYALWEALEIGGMTQTLSADFHRRTPALLGICCNVFVFNYFNGNKMLDAMRGVIFPTLIYIAIWLYWSGIL